MIAFLNEYLNSGWLLGTPEKVKSKISLSNTGKIKSGHNKGGPKLGSKPWNKGRKETRPDVIHKMSSSHIGKPRVPHTDETKQKIAESEKRTKQAKKLVATEINVQLIKRDVQ